MLVYSHVVLVISPVVLVSCCISYLSHILRKDDMENLCITGFIDGKRSRGRQRITFLGSLCKRMNGQVPEQNLTLAKLLITARDRREWKTMITYVFNGHGT